MGDEGVWVRNGSALAGSRGSGLGGKNCWYGVILFLYIICLYMFTLSQNAAGNILSNNRHQCGVLS